MSVGVVRVNKNIHFIQVPTGYDLILRVVFFFLNQLHYLLHHIPAFIMNNTIDNQVSSNQTEKPAVIIFAPSVF